MKRQAGKLFGLLLVLASASANLFAQATATGTIAGAVFDNSQAVIVGAQVVALHKASGASRTTTTSDTGNYRFDLMSPGSYVISITKTGFARYEENIQLVVGQTATTKATLKAGSASEVVEVTGEAAIIDQNKTAVSQNFTPSEVEDLPLLGRDVANLAYLAPGVKAADSYDPTKNRYAVLSVNGQDGRNVNVTVNGIDNKDNTVGGPVMQLPLEAVQEFAISTQRFSAANGRSEGAAINMITKSGSNSYHGSVFGFFRDEALNAIDTQAAKNGQKPPYSRQFFGGSVGGPFIKDKLFGFFAFERQREHTSLAERPKAFTELSLVTSLGAKPAAVIPTPFFENRYNGRLDYHLSNRHTAYISYSAQNNNGENDQSDQQGDLTGGNFTTNHLIAANLTLNSLLTNSLVNSFTFGHQYWNNNIGSNVNAPYITFNSGEWFGRNTNVPQKSFQHKWQFRDDITKTLGKHTLKGGVDYIWTPRVGGFFVSNGTLEIDFAKDPSEILADPRGFAAPGLVAGMSQSVGDPKFVLNVKQLGFYFQDDWKVTSRLMLDLGVRWDKDFNLIGASAIQNSRTFQELRAINSPFAGLPNDDNKDFSPRIGFAYDLTGQGRHVVRGGYGLYFDNVFQNIPLFMIQQSNPTIYQGVFSISSGSEVVPGTGGTTLAQWRYGVDPFPTIPGASTQLNAGSIGRLMDPKYRNPYSEEVNIGYQWAITDKSVFEADYVHTLGLHENKTVTLNPIIDPLTSARATDALFIAAGVPKLGSIRDEQSVNRSRYDGLNLSYRQRMTRRFSLNANYTLSRAMGWSIQSGFPTVGSGFRNYPHDPRNIWDPRDFGPTPNDERHHVTLSGMINLPWGFQAAPVLQFGSARPYDLNEGYDVLGIGTGYSRPVIVNNNDPANIFAFATAPKAGNPGSASECLAAGQCHQVGYNTMRGDAFFQLDTRVAKNVHLGESRNLELMFQAFNLTNKTNFGNNMINTVSSPDFGKPAGFINPNSTSIPRAFVGEFGARFTF